MVSRRTAPRAALVAVIASVLVWLGAFTLPLYSSSSSNGRSGHATLVHVNGGRVLIVLGIPVVIALVGWLATVGRLPRVALPIACVLMWIWTVLTGFSVGLLYLPVDAALVAALAAIPKRAPVDRTRVADSR